MTILSKMKKIFPLLILIFCVEYSPAIGQDAAFSQFYENPLLRNPALAGIFDGDFRVSGIFRNQWQSITTPFRTAGLGIETKFAIGNAYDFFTVGVQLTEDAAGDINLKRTQILPVINFHKSLSEAYDSYLSLAFMGGAVNSQFDATKLHLDDQFVNGSFNANNPSQQVFNNTGKTYWDLGTGLVYSAAWGNNNSCYIGASLFHFNNPKIAFFTNNELSTTLHRKFTINTGITLPTSDVNKLMFHADYFRQSAHQQFIAGGIYAIEVSPGYYSNYKTVLSLGGFYRWKDALIPVVKLEYNHFVVGMSYDATLSQLSTSAQIRGGLELTSSYRTNLNVLNQEAKKVRCVRL